MNKYEEFNDHIQSMQGVLYDMLFHSSERDVVKKLIIRMEELLKEFKEKYETVALPDEINI